MRHGSQAHNGVQAQDTRQLGRGDGEVFLSLNFLGTHQQSGCLHAQGVRFPALFDLGPGVGDLLALGKVLFRQTQSLYCRLGPGQFDEATRHVEQHLVGRRLGLETAGNDLLPGRNRLKNAVADMNEDLHAGHERRLSAVGEGTAAQIERTGANVQHWPEAACSTP